MPSRASHLYAVTPVCIEELPKSRNLANLRTEATAQIWDTWGSYKIVVRKVAWFKPHDGLLKCGLSGYHGAATTEGIPWQRNAVLRVTR